MTKSKHIILFVSATLLIIACSKPDNATADVEEANSPQQHWTWPDSLDALVAAPQNHELVFENDELRILKVTVVSGITDPVHTHSGRSIIWVTKTSPILYNVYDYNENNGLHLVDTDTIVVKPEELFKGTWEKPEPPHSVEILAAIRSSYTE